MNKEFSGNNELRDAKTAPCTRVIRDGDYIFLRLSTEKQTLVQVYSNRMLNLKRIGKVHGSELVGKHYDLTYVITSNRKVEHFVNNSADAEEIISEVDAEKNNNMEIYDDNTNQRLSHDDIMRIKDSVYGAEELIGKIVSNNQSFEKRTQFSKEKYLKRKRSRHLNTFVPVEVDAITLCEHFFTFSSVGIGHIRMDLQSLILSSANIHAGARVLLLDDTHGTVTNSVLDRMNGLGTLHVLQDSRSFAIDNVKYMNFSRKQLEPLKVLPVCLAFPLEGEIEDKNEQMGIVLNENIGRQVKAKREDLMQGEFDALIIASNYDAISAFELVEHLLGASKTLTVFSHSMTLLYPLYARLRGRHDYILVTLQSTWHRPYQTLPGRMHPAMRVTAQGGVLLTATKIAAGEPVPSTIEGHDLRTMHGRRKRPADDDACAE